MKKICIVFLGNFLTDARCINMAQTILNSGKYSLSIISLQDTEQSFTGSLFKGVRFFNLKISNIKIFKYFNYYSRVKNIIKENKFDVIIASDLYSLSGVCSSNNKVIYDSREIYSELEAHVTKPLYCWFWKKYEKYYLQFIKDVIVTADSDAVFLRNLYPFNNLSFYTIFNYPKYQQYIKTNLLREKFNISENCKIILYQGVIQRGRGISRLIQTINRSSQFSGVIIGDGIMKKIYKNEVKKNKLESRIFFVDAVPYNDLFKYTAAADIGWLLINKKSISNKFALPNKLFEYILMGVPVVSSNIKNITDIIYKHNLGVVVKNEKDLLECENALANLIAMDLDSIALHKIAKKYFVWEKQKNAFLTILSK